MALPCNHVSATLKRNVVFCQGFSIFFSPREAQQCRSNTQEVLKQIWEVPERKKTYMKYQTIEQHVWRILLPAFWREKPDQRIRQKVWSSRNKDWAKTTIKHDEVQVAVLFLILKFWAETIQSQHWLNGNFSDIWFIFAHTIPNLTPASKQFVISHHSPVITLQTHLPIWIKSGSELCINI